MNDFILVRVQVKKNKTNFGTKGWWPKQKRQKVRKDDKLWEEAFLTCIQDTINTYIFVFFYLMLSKSFWMAKVNNTVWVSTTKFHSWRTIQYHVHHFVVWSDACRIKSQWKTQVSLWPVLSRNTLIKFHRRARLHWQASPQNCEVCGCWHGYTTLLQEFSFRTLLDKKQASQSK